MGVVKKERRPLLAVTRDNEVDVPEELLSQNMRIAILEKKEELKKAMAAVGRINKDYNDTRVPVGTGLVFF